MGFVVKLFFISSVLFIVNHVGIDGRIYRDVYDRNDVVRRSPAAQGPPKFPAFPGDEDENVEGDQDQGRNRWELEHLTDPPRTTPNYGNRGGNRQPNPNGREPDVTREVEYVTGRGDRTTERAVETGKVPWYKKVGHFFKNTYNKVVNKFRGERDNGYDYE